MGRFIYRIGMEVELLSQKACALVILIITAKLSSIKDVHLPEIGENMLSDSCKTVYHFLIFANLIGDYIFPEYIFKYYIAVLIFLMT